MAQSAGSAAGFSGGAGQANKERTLFWRRVVRLTDRVINWMTVLCLIPILLFAIYALWDTEQVYMAAAPGNYSSYKPTDKMSFAELMEYNPDVFAWLSIYGTNIDYPVAQGEDNDEYINTDVFGNFALSGALFLDYRNSRDFSAVNNIIYGHHMERQLMFGQIQDFSKKKFFKKHRYGKIYYGDRWYGIEIVAFLQADAYDPVIYNPGCGRSTYLAYVQSHAERYRETDLEESTNFVTLSTCADMETNGRHILIGRIMDWVPEDPFAEEEAAAAASRALIMKILKIALLITAILLFIILTLLVRRMRAQGKLAGPGGAAAGKAKRKRRRAGGKRRE